MIDLRLTISFNERTKDTLVGLNSKKRENKNGNLPLVREKM